jgi:hypothetical protein
MNALEKAPPKIYLPRFATGKLTGQFWLNNNPGDVEYIRADLMPRWVSVKEELPQESTINLCLVDGVFRTVDFYLGNFGGKGITHWLKNTPPIPEEKKP